MMVDVCWMSDVLRRCDGVMVERQDSFQYFIPEYCVMTLPVCTLAQKLKTNSNMLHQKMK
jgi:hypothetical protein